jgi:hypothetical protein
VQHRPCAAANSESFREQAGGPPWIKSEGKIKNYETSCAPSIMNLRWLTMTLRLVGLILIVCAAVVFFSGGLSFRSETQTSSDSYEIHHTVILSRSAIIPGVVGVIIFASSLFTRSKRV